MTKVNLNLNYEGFEKDFFYSARSEADEWSEYVFRFGNNFGARVSKKRYNPGYVGDWWFLTVIQFVGDNYDPYDDEIIEVGGPDEKYVMSDESVRKKLAEIKGMK